MEATACSCPTCRQMCENSVCMPTPDQVRTLIDRGYAHRLARFDPRGPDGQQRPRFVAPAPRGLEGATLQSTNGHGPCTFFDGQACELHALDLKPEEGRLAHHDCDPQEVRRRVYVTWLQPTMKAPV